MAAPNAYDALVDQAVTALRRAAQAPPVAPAADAAVELIVREWQVRPFTVGIAGDVALRTQLLDRACAGGMLDHDARVPSCARIRVRRGPVTRFRATRTDGSCEELTLLPPPLPLLLDTRIEGMEAEVAARLADAARADEAVPRVARIPPPWWAFWWWLVRWWVLLTARRAIAHRTHAHAEVATARRALADAANEVPTIIVSLPDPRDQFLERLAVLSSGKLAGDGVRSIELEVAAGPLALDVEIIESATAEEVDELITLERDAVGSMADLIATLDTLPARSRAVRLTRWASEVLAAAIRKLDDLIANAEVGLRNRIARFENLRLHDADGFVESQIATVSAPLSASIHAVLAHAGVHLGAELARCAASWLELVDNADTTDDLKAAALRVDEEAQAAARRIGEETRILVVGGVGGCAHDLLPELFAPLRDPGVPDEYTQPPRSAPALPLIEILPSLVNPSSSHFASELGGAGKWLSGLFRTIDARRAELRDKVQQRADHVREVAEAEMLDAEPHLRAALQGTIVRELAAAADRRIAWVAQELAKERIAVDAERAALRPLAVILDDVRIDARSLHRVIGEREAAT